MKQNYQKTLTLCLLMAAGLGCFAQTEEVTNIFHANTVEGIDMLFSIVSEEEKTCQVGATVPDKEGYYYYAIDKNTEGTVTIPEIANGYKVVAIEGAAFKNHTAITNVIIPDGVTSIGNSTFEGCTGLPSITLPSSLTSIDIYAFYQCTGLTSITLPAGMTTIEEGVFGRCTGLTSVNLPDGLTTIDSFAFRYCAGLSSITLPEGLTTIGIYAFDYCTGLTSVTFPKSLKTVGNYAFNNCTGLQTVNISSIDAWLGIEFSNNRSNPTWYSKGLYLNGEPVTDVVVPEDITVLGNYQFKQVETLKSIKLHEGVTTIGKNTFQGCFNLSDINFPSSLAFIGSEAFHLCKSIAQPIDLSQTKVDSIPDVTFYMCYNLPSVKLPASLRYLGERSFGTDTCLVSITSYAEDPSVFIKSSYSRLPFDCFDDVGYKVEEQLIYQRATLYVPKGTVEAYRNTTVFGQFENILEMGEESGIGTAVSESTAVAESIYDLQGRKLQQYQRGMNVLRFTDGTARKIMVR